MVEVDLLGSGHIECHIASSRVMLVVVLVVVWEICVALIVICWSMSTSIALLRVVPIHRG